MSLERQARFPLIARLASAQGDATNGTAAQPGGPNRHLLQANYTGYFAPLPLILLVPASPVISLQTSSLTNYCRIPVYCLPPLTRLMPVALSGLLSTWRSGLLTLCLTPSECISWPSPLLCLSCDVAIHQGTQVLTALGVLALIPHTITQLMSSLQGRLAANETCNTTCNTQTHALAHLFRSPSGMRRDNCMAMQGLRTMRLSSGSPVCCTLCWWCTPLFKP